MYDASKKLFIWIFVAYKGISSKYFKYFWGGLWGVQKNCSILICKSLDSFKKLIIYYKVNTNSVCFDAVFLSTMWTLLMPSFPLIEDIYVSMSIINYSTWPALNPHPPSHLQVTLSIPYSSLLFSSPETIPSSTLFVLVPLNFHHLSPRPQICCLHSIPCSICVIYTCTTYTIFVVI